MGSSFRFGVMWRSGSRRKSLETSESNSFHGAMVVATPLVDPLDAPGNSLQDAARLQPTSSTKHPIDNIYISSGCRTGFLCARRLFFARVELSWPWGPFLVD